MSVERALELVAQLRDHWALLPDEHELAECIEWLINQLEKKNVK